MAIKRYNPINIRFDLFDLILMTSIVILNNKWKQTIIRPLAQLANTKQLVLIIDFFMTRKVYVMSTTLKHQFVLSYFLFK